MFIEYFYSLGYKPKTKKTVGLAAFWIGKYVCCTSYCSPCLGRLREYSILVVRTIPVGRYVITSYVMLFFICNFILQTYNFFFKYANVFALFFVGRSVFMIRFACSYR